MTTNSYTLDAADALCRGRFGVPLNDKSINETCRAALLRDADATIAQAVADNARLRRALERIAASCREMLDGADCDPYDMVAAFLDDAEAALGAAND